MARLSRLHWEAVPAPVSALLRGLSGVLEPMDLYLAGGTALALQLGHRISQDIDPFSRSLADPDALFAVLRGRYPSAVATLVAERTLYAEDEPPLRLLADIDWPTVKNDLVRWTQELLEV